MSSNLKRRLLASVGGALFLVACAASAAMVALPLSAGHTFLNQAGAWEQTEAPWAEASFTLPEEAAEVTLMRRNAHPLLAEYHRRIRVEVPGSAPLAFDLPMNLGGDTQINVYLTPVSFSGYEGMVLHMEDTWGRYLVDVGTPALLNVDADLPVVHGVYLGRFDGSGGSLRFVPAAEADFATVVPTGTLGTHKAKEETDQP